jgi:hypothetical protein
VLGRTVVLRGSSGSLNTGSCSFHLVAARETRVAGWCKGEQVFFVIQVGACVTGSWCFHPVGAGTYRELVLEKPRSWCFLLVGARETRELVLSNKLQLVKQR